MRPIVKSAVSAAANPPADGFINRFTAANAPAGVPTAPARPSTARKPLRVRHTLDRHGAPLLEVINLPGEGAELSPGAARQLAQALIDAAADAEDLHAHGALRRKPTFEYPL